MIEGAVLPGVSFCQGGKSLSVGNPMVLIGVSYRVLLKRPRFGWFVKDWDRVEFIKSLNLDSSSL